MAKEKKTSNAVQTASEQLAKAQIEYQKLVRDKKSTQAARTTALKAKRLARAKLYAAKHNLPEPTAEDLVETKAGA